MKNKMTMVAMWMAGFSIAAHAEGLQQPSPEQARMALSEMFGEATMFARAQVVLGTCLPVPKPPHQEQVSCTVTVLTPGGSSETQADFYTKAGHWTSEPATRQDLPFPDPKLADVHWTAPAAR